MSHFLVKNCQLTTQKQLDVILLKLKQITNPYSIGRMITNNNQSVAAAEDQRDFNNNGPIASDLQLMQEEDSTSSDTQQGRQT